jgi:hypothetical protein
MLNAAAGSVGIAVMAKAPRAGSCKTRLVPMLSPEHAAAMSAAFLGDITENLMLAAQSAPIAPYVAYAPADARPAFDGLIAPGTNLLLADGSATAPPGVAGFGKCLLHAIGALLGRGHRAACVLNSDSPNLPTRVLVQAAEMLLHSEDRVVIGPAEDGGYYFLGMRRAHAALFSDIDWSTSRVAAQTRERAAPLGVPVIELEPWYDVDDPASLRRLLRALSRDAGGEFEAPRTRAIARLLGLLAEPSRNEAAAHWTEHRAVALGAIT